MSVSRYAVRGGYVEVPGGDDESARHLQAMTKRKKSMGDFGSHQFGRKGFEARKQGLKVVGMSFEKRAR